MPDLHEMTINLKNDKSEVNSRREVSRKTWHRYGMNNVMIAETLGVSPITVGTWYVTKNGVKELVIPPKYCPLFEVLTGIRCEELNPEIFTERWTNTVSKEALPVIAEVFVKLK